MAPNVKFNVWKKYTNLFSVLESQCICKYGTYFKLVGVNVVVLECIPYSAEITMISA